MPCSSGDSGGSDIPPWYARFTTYAIVGKPGEICLNGAAARLVHRGDKVIVLSFADVDEDYVPEFVPRIVIVDEENKPVA